MSWTGLMRAEMRKLATTPMPLAFLAVIALVAAINAALVVFGTDMDGSKAFVSTAADQQSLVAFAANATMGAGLFGAIAAAREYAHGTVIPTFLAAPRRHRAVVAQLVAIAVFGAILSVIGTVLIVGAVAISLATTDFTFLMSAGEVVRVIAAAAFAGAVGAVLGAGVGSLVRNTGGAVTGVVFLLIIAPPLLVQLISGAGSWMPSTLANVLSGVGTDTTVPAALLALAAWALVPAAAGLVAVERRDVA